MIHLGKIGGIGFIKGRPDSRLCVLPPTDAPIVIFILKTKPDQDDDDDDDDNPIVIFILETKPNQDSYMTSTMMISGLSKMMTMMMMLSMMTRMMTMTMMMIFYFFAVSSSVGLSVSRSSRSSTARVSWVSRC